MSIKEKIQLLCKENQTNIKTIEKTLAFGSGTINKWDKSSPSIEKLMTVANYFKVSVAWLIGEVDIRNFDDIKQYSKHEKELLNMYRTLSTEVKKVIDVNIEMQYKIAIKSKLNEEQVI